MSAGSHPVGSRLIGNLGCQGTRARDAQVTNRFPFKVTVPAA
jgi:hypothetical protein